MGDDEEEEKPKYKYEGEREEGASEEVTVTITHEEKGELSKTDSVKLLGARSGKGTATFPNNDVYEGSFEKGARSGMGKYTYAAPPPTEEDAGDEPPKPVAVYEGGWVKGQKSGVGTMTYADGSKYQGSWHKGKRSGIGAFYYINGDIYSGDWAQGKKHGHGTYIYKATQTRLKGTWEQGNCVSGEFTDRHGNVYKGAFTPSETGLQYAEGGSFTFASGAAAPYETPWKVDRMG